MFKLKKILLVDDDEVSNFINEAILEELDIADQVDVRQNGQEALDYVMHHCALSTGSCPALVILDHHMPIMDGMEFMEAFDSLSLNYKDDIVFLVLAASTRPENVERFKTLGVQEFCPKPLSKERVMEVYYKYWGKASFNI